MRQLDVRQAPAEIEDPLQLAHDALHKGPDAVEHGCEGGLDPVQ